MAQRRCSRARRDPDLDDDEGGGSPPSRRPRRSAGSDDDDEGNEDLSLDIVARSRRKQRGGASGGGGDTVSAGPLLTVSSGDDEEVDEDAVVELGEAEEPRRKQRKKQRRKQRKKQRKEATEAAAVADAAGGEEEKEKEKEVGGTQEGPSGTAESVLTEDGATADVPASDNMVLRKLLRIPRYFDPGETLLETCFNCSEEGHVAANCPMEKRKKPCFVCGLFGHNAKQCTQGQDCFICKKGGHMAKDCPDKHKTNDHQSTLCLRCGEIGHDMFGCTNDYPPDDIKQIRCYVCNQSGHLCCADFSDGCPKQISCYNCARSGHSGLGCAKQRREASAVTTPTVCFKCNEEGHFARGCTKNAKSDRSKGRSSSHIQRKERWKKESGARSAPHGAHKTSKRKSPHFEDRMDTPWHKSKARGGWTGGDDLDDLPFKKYKSNGWGSPSTPKKPYTNHQSSGGDYFTPQSSRRHSHGFASPNSNHSPSTRKHSRFAASNTHVRFGGS